MTPRLAARYAEPQRRYHTLEHIEACLTSLARVEGLSEEDRRTLERAIWWHDAIYDPRASDNEERSADLARNELAEMGVPSQEQEEVARLILLTKGHTVPDDDQLGAILVSIDLSILGAELPAYDRYARQVREEYAHVPETLWRPGRSAVLKHFLDAPVIYPEPGFRARLEALARANLARELAALA